jgi:beta-galactosidase
MKLRVVLHGILCMIVCLLGHASVAQTFDVDVRQKGLTPNETALPAWGGKNTSGDVVSANNYYFELNGKPLVIIAGEMQPQRYPAEEWEDAIVKMKAAGLNTISFYVYWSLIEPEPGKFDFSGRNNIRQFVELCKKHGLYVFLRPGPFNNSEIFLGGLPPWHYGMVHNERSNDPGYLKYVQRYYRRLAAHLKGYFWDDGGNIIAIQPENELSHAPISWNTLFEQGVGDGYPGPQGAGYTAHYEHLYDIAKAAGMNSPIFTMTSWGATGPLPTDHFVPTYGGYMYLGPPGDANSALTLFDEVRSSYTGKVPVGFCEVGTGSPSRGSYRPDVPAASCLCTALTLFGSQETLFFGYYLFHGGTNPLHPVYGFMPKWRDLSYMSYDFDAPVSEYGLLRESYFDLRPFNYFLNDFSESLANTQVVDFDRPVRDPQADSLRLIARADHDRGYILAANYGNLKALSARNNVHIRVKTSAGSISIPQVARLNIGSGDFAIIPFNYRLATAVTLVSATAWPFGHISKNNEDWYFYHSLSASDGEFVLAGKGIRSVTCENGSRAKKDVWILKAGGDGQLTIHTTGRQVIHLVLLTEEQARHSTEVTIAGQRTLLLSNQEVMEDSVSHTLLVTSPGMNRFQLKAIPGVDRLKIDGQDITAQKAGIFSVFSYQVPERKIHLEIDSINSEKTVLKVSPDQFDGLDDIELKVNYLGDICRVFDISQGMIKGDNFYNGQPWDITLRRFKSMLAGDGLLFRVGPKLLGVEQSSASNGMLLDLKNKLGGNPPSLKSLTAVPVYKIKVEWPDTRYLTNGIVKVGIDLNKGGSITYLSGQPDGRNLINSYDLGRQIQMSFYSGPVPYHPAGTTLSKAWEGLGWNPIQSGDYKGHKGRIVSFKQKKNTLYVKTVPMQWPLDSVPCECTMESWITVKGHTVQVRARINIDRADTTQYPARTQELPAIYTNAPFKYLYTYTGNKPFSDDTLTLIKNSNPSQGGQEIRWAGWQATEHWAALVDHNGWGLGIYNSAASHFSGGFAGDENAAGGEKDYPTGYLSPNANVLLGHHTI